MPEPTLEDAIAVLRDPACRLLIADPRDNPEGFVQVNGDKVVSRLLELGAATPDDALTLAEEALRAVRGKDRSRWLASEQQGGGGLPRAKRVHIFLVPIEDQ